MTDKLEASRLTPETLRDLDRYYDGSLGDVVWHWVRRCADAWAADIAHQGKQIEDDMLDPLRVMAKPFMDVSRVCKALSTLEGDGSIGYAGLEIEFYNLFSRYLEALGDIEDSGKEIERLREQLRAYRGAERTAHDEMEGLAWL